MSRRVLVRLSPEQEAIVGAHVRAVAEAQRGLRLALRVSVPEFRVPGADFDAAAMTVSYDEPDSPVTGSSTITRKGGEQDAEGR